MYCWQWNPALCCNYTIPSPLLPRPFHVNMAHYAPLQRGGVQASMVPPAIASLVVFTVGAPVAFLAILLFHAKAVQQDQCMRMLNQGGTEAANPNFHVRARFQEL